MKNMQIDGVYSPRNVLPDNALAAVPQPAGGVVSVVSVKITSNVSQHVYLCSVYANGYAVAATATAQTLHIPQIASGEIIPNNSWLRAGKVGGVYEGQIPVWQ